MHLKASNRIWKYKQTSYIKPILKVLYIWTFYEISKNKLLDHDMISNLDFHSFPANCLNKLASIGLHTSVKPRFSLKTFSIFKSPELV